MTNANSVEFVFGAPTVKGVFPNRYGYTVFHSPVHSPPALALCPPVGYTYAPQATLAGQRCAAPFAALPARGILGGLPSPGGSTFATL